LIAEKDKELVLVYMIQVAGWHAGKGGTYMGRNGAVEVLRSLDQEMVKKRLDSFRYIEDQKNVVKPEIDWIAGQLGLKE
jgi:nitrogenase molybdenum-iron protein alpha/beta subunit